MEKILLVLTAFIICGTSFAQGQQLENPGFEDAWETSGVSGAEPEPAEWSSLKSADALAALAPVVAFQETNSPHSGSYCIRLLVVNSFGVNAAGLLTNGRVHADFNPQNGYVYTETSDSIWHLQFTDRPDSLTFWVKHAPQNSDESKLEIVLHDDSYAGTLPHDGTTSHWVGKARADITGTINTWSRVSVPFEYYNNSTPDYCLATISAGDSTVAEEDTEMWIDDIELIYNPLTVDITPPAQQTINTSTNGTTLTVNYTTNAGVTATPTQEWKYSTTSGGPYSAFGTAETGTTYTPNFATAGIYYVVCDVDFGTQGVMTSSNEVEIIVNDPNDTTVTITPGATQTINANEDGNVLTANESPISASSREWMWTTTSGSGYQSFSPVETNGTYTPNFTTAGTYYVICESDFAGNVKMSNEVTVMVNPEGTGIDEDDLHFQIYNTGSFVQVEYDQAHNGSVIELFTLDGKQVYRSNITEGASQHNMNVTPGVYIYRLVDGDLIITGKINL